ncbi:MarR family transcriptional regulator [Jatrophihabitans telluris]|uniref:MarR family transcriptional regulator n=1 Tax=Jatrophihabitans telluris TaxID=2038343 RepID=A0ABY4QWR1_9ACTN|nr:MarR family transcriptional regulator [Jatrophihabitans telluris]UQX87592.1 MarR family transcriptional regulator [Jatrophihabitans telluris]
MSQFSDDEITRLRIALRRIVKLVDRHVSVDGMTHTQLSVLGTVVRRGPLSASELAELEGINPTMLSRVIGKLEQAGLLTRTPDPDDRRALQIQATAAGQRLQHRLRRQRGQLFTERVQLMAPEHSALLLDALPALESLAIVMDDSAPTPTPTPAPTPTSTPTPTPSPSR